MALKLFENPTENWAVSQAVGSGDIEDHNARKWEKVGLFQKHECILSVVQTISINKANVIQLDVFWETTQIRSSGIAIASLFLPIPRTKCAHYMVKAEERMQELFPTNLPKTVRDRFLQECVECINSNSGRLFQKSELTTPFNKIINSFSFHFSEKKIERFTNCARLWWAFWTKVIGKTSLNSFRRQRLRGSSELIRSHSNFRCFID